VLFRSLNLPSQDLDLISPLSPTDISRMNSGFGGPFWETKMRTFFRRYDADGDGIVTVKDYDRLSDTYAQIGKLDEVKAKQVRNKIVKIWYDYFEADSENGQITEQIFVDSIRARDNPKVIETSTQFHGLFFDLIDLSGDGIIQKAEYEIFCKVFGIHDEEVIDQCFKALDTNGDGQLSYEEFTHAGSEYFTRGDESLPSKYLYGPLITK